MNKLFATTCLAINLAAVHHTIAFAGAESTNASATPHAEAANKTQEEHSPEEIHQTSVGGAEFMTHPSAKPLNPPEFLKNESIDLSSKPEAPDQNANSNAQQIFTIEKIITIGNTVFSNEKLHELTKYYENRDVDIAELEALRQDLTAFYVKEGYINSGARILFNSYKDKNFTIIIIEGTLDEVKVHGQQGLRKGYIQNRLLPDPKEPFNVRELQNRFQLLSEDPLFKQLNGTISPGDSPGHSILDMKVTRKTPWKLDLVGNNYRPPSIGAEAFGIEGEIHDLTGFGDTLNFNYYGSEGSDRFSGGLDLPITDSGYKAFFRFDEGDSVVIEQSLQNLNIKSKIHSLEGGLSRSIPLPSDFKPINHQLTLGALLAVRENQTSLLSVPFSFVQGDNTGKNQATVLRTFQNYLYRADIDTLAFRSTFSVGINALGSTPSTQSAYPSSEFFSWLGQFQYAHKFPELKDSQLVFRGNAQFSDKPLLPLEQLSAGGRYSVRGYRENYFVRDEGYSLTAEYHFPLCDKPVFDIPFNLGFVPFTDYGQAWNHYDTQGTGNALSVGAGLDLKLSSILQAELYYGYPLLQPTYQRTGNLQDQALHFQLRLGIDSITKKFGLDPFAKNFK